MGALEADRCSHCRLRPLYRLLTSPVAAACVTFYTSRGRRSARHRRRKTNCCCSDLQCFPLAGSGISGSVRVSPCCGVILPPTPNNQEFQTSQLISYDETGAGGAGILVQIGSGQLIINLQEAGLSPCLPPGGWQEHNP